MNALKTCLTRIIAPILIAVALLGAADVGPFAPARVEATQRKGQHFYVGPFQQQSQADAAANLWRDRGYITSVFFQASYGGWMVAAQKR